MIKTLLISVALLASCASLDRSDGHGTPPDITGDPSDTGPKHEDPNDPPVCPPPKPECMCDDDCRTDESCHHGKCYEECKCDDDCSGPGNQSCDHGLCKGH